MTASQLQSFQNQGASGISQRFCGEDRSGFLEQVKSFVEPLPRPQFFCVVKLADDVVVKNNVVVARVEQDAGGISRRSTGILWRRFGHWLG